MKAFNGYADAEKSAQYKGAPKLPEGAYIVEVKAVKYEDGVDGNSDRIAIQFDIAEGEYKGFFKTQYESNTNEDKKWKGSVRIYVPIDDGSEKDGWTKRSFAGWTTSFEASNKGYKWDWNEQGWKGLKVGIVFGTTGTVIEGKEVTYTEPRYAVSVDEVRKGTVKPAKFKAKNGYTGSGNSSVSTTNDGFMNMNVAEEEIPF